MYYYIETEDKIPDAFTDCLGGLLSVFAQNLNLIVQPTNGQSSNIGVSNGTNSVNCCYTILKVNTAYTHTLQDNQVTVRLPDIYSEECRDIVLEIQVNPLLSSPSHLEPRPIFDCKLEYFNVVSCKQESVSCVCQLARPDVAQPNVIPLELDLQRNRIRSTAAMAQAKQLAERSELEPARALLRKAIEETKASLSASHPTTVDLLSDLQRCLDNMTDQYTFGTVGCRQMTCCLYSNCVQRSCGSNSYTTPIKRLSSYSYQMQNQL
jgi:hypothetical protein